MKTRAIFRGGRTLSVMPTYACTAACRNCGTFSNPKDPNHLPLDQMISGIEQAKRLGFSNVVFTGGEATLRWDDLLMAIRYASSLGLPTRLVTNGHWAATPERAAAGIAALMEAGLGEFNLSTGDEHVRFVPIERVAMAASAAVRRGLTTSVMIELRADNSIRRNTLLEQPALQQLTPEQRDSIIILESPWMPLNPMQTAKYPDGALINADNVAATTGCSSVLQTYVLAGDGRIGSCCGLGMRVISELNVARAEGENFLEEAIEEAEGDILKMLLHYRGPEKILAWAASKDPSIDWANRYAHHCQACMRIYKDPKVGAVIREHYAEFYAELAEDIWLEEQFIPMRMAASSEQLVQIQA